MPHYGRAGSPETRAIIAQAIESGRNIYKIHVDGNNYTRMMGVIRRIRWGERELSEYDEEWIKIKGSKPSRREDFTDAVENVKARTNYLNPEKSRTYKENRKGSFFLAWQDGNTGYLKYKQIIGLVADMTDEERSQKRGHDRARLAKKHIDSGNRSLVDYNPDYTLRGRIISSSRSAGGWGCKLRDTAVRGDAEPPRRHRIVYEPEVPSWCLERHDPPLWKKSLRETPGRYIFG